MVKQRSKAELLAFIRTSQTMKKDAGREDSITWKTERKMDYEFIRMG